MSHSWVTIMVLGCGGRTGPRTPPPSSSQLTTPAPVAARTTDRCTYIPLGCPGTADEDGCPDFIFDTACSLGTSDRKTLAVMAKELQAEPRLTRVRIVAATTECASGVAETLVAGWIASKRLQSQARPDIDYIYVEVAAWDGTECRP